MGWRYFKPLLIQFAIAAPMRHVMLVTGLSSSTPLGRAPIPTWVALATIGLGALSF